MGIFDFVKNGARELFIARPDEAKGLIVYKHPDPTIPNQAQITVGQDEVALFFKDGQFVGRLEAGRHELAAKNIPFLSLLVDKFTGGNLYRAEIWFITTREIAGLKFGGRIGDLEDPKSGLAVQTMVHGDFSIQVEDPLKVIAFFGQRSWSTDDEFSGWFRDQLLKVIRDRIAEMMVKQSVPLLTVTSGALTEEIEPVVVSAVRPHLVDYGMRVVRLGNFVVSIKSEDEEQLKALYKDAAQIRLAGGMVGFQQYAAAKAMIGAGEGMAKGAGKGGDNPLLGGAGLGVGFALAQRLGQPGDAATGVAHPEARCAKCGAPAAGGSAKFCAECGAPFAPSVCPSCGRPLASSAKFCAECGSKTSG